MRASPWPSSKTISWARREGHRHSQRLTLQRMTQQQCSITWWIHHRRNSWSARSCSPSYLLKKNSCQMQLTPLIPSDTRVNSARHLNVLTRCWEHSTRAKWRRWSIQRGKISSRTPPQYSRSNEISHKWWEKFDKRAKGNASRSSHTFQPLVMRTS